MFPILNEANNCKFFRVYTIVTTPNLPAIFWKESHLFANALIGSDSSQYVIIFQSWIDADYFNLWDRPCLGVHRWNYLPET